MKGAFRIGFYFKRQLKLSLLLSLKKIDLGDPCIEEMLDNGNVMCGGPDKLDTCQRLSAVTGYKCECKSPYTGQHCESIDWCNQQIEVCVISESYVGNKNRVVIIH